MRCPSAQERVPENLAEGLGLRAFVRAAPVLTKVTSGVPETHRKAPRSPLLQEALRAPSSSPEAGDSCMPWLVVPLSPAKTSQDGG